MNNTELSIPKKTFQTGKDLSYKYKTYNNSMVFYDQMNSMVKCLKYC